MLTTHSMTEAEALCTRIGIMAGGKMRVLGDQVDICARYGTGTSLHMQLPVSVDAKDSTSDLAVRVLAAENAAMDRVVAALKGELQGDTTTTTLAIRHDLKDALAGTRARGGVCVSNTWQWEVRVSVLLAPGADLARVFAFVAGGGIESVVDFGLNNCSLEDVFIQVSSQYFNGSA
ncbi:hypothetical protein BC828DRAFT_404238 [Blastocladiella britannica]|nr:hypothetical protein BC828DRAFT_404238 [Blastocladiella britannica]